MPRRGSNQPPKSAAHMELGHALRELREASGYRLVDLSSTRYGENGRSEGLLSRIENGLDTPSWHVIRLYATEFNGDLAKLRRLLARVQIEEATTQTSEVVAPQVLKLSAYPLTVAVALVLHKQDVLLVKRARPEGELDWQFPSGVVKPIDSPGDTAIREVMGETGIIAKTLKCLGQRIHPVTNAQCIYFHCEYLGGEIQNLDTNENALVSWVSIDRLPSYIPVRNIFQGILTVLHTIVEGKQSHG